jgi:hypothetical protein
MLRTRALEVSLWEAVLPEEVLRLPGELARVDALLDDPVFSPRSRRELRLELVGTRRYANKRQLVDRLRHGPKTSGTNASHMARCGFSRYVRTSA